MRKNKSEVHDRNIDSNSITEAKSRKKAYYVVGSIATLMVIMITTYMLMMPAVTMSGDPICGMSEHTHDDSCYSVVNVDNSEETFSLDGAINLSDEEERVLSCGLEEHTHTDSCYQAQETETTEVTELSTSEIQEEEFVSEEINYEDYDAQLLDGDGYLLIDDSSDITSTVLKYQCSHEGTATTNWTDVTSAVTIHGDDSLKMDLNYSLPFSTIKSNNYTVKYHLPAWMNDIDSDEGVPITQTIKNADNSVSDTIQIGTLQATDGYLVATLDRDYIDGFSINSNFNGTLSMSATINASEVNKDTLHVGNADITVDYDSGTWISTYGGISIEKSQATYKTGADGADYLTYTLTVKNGDSLMPDVEVTDSFNESVQNRITNIKDFSETLNGDATNTNNASYDSTTHILTWNIGDMQAGEIRTLTYNVMLDPSKTRLYAGKYGTLFENSAVLSSKGIERQTAVSDFKELSSLSPYKYVANYTLDDDGIGGTITYAIKLVAPSTNTVPLDNAKLYDFIRSASNQVSYVEDSMYLYTGNQITDNNYTNSYGVAQNQIYKVYPTSDTINDSNYSPKFTLNIGNFAPGTTKWLYYQVHVDESMYLNQNGGKFTIQNRVQTYDKNDVIGTDSPIEGCNKDLDITFTEWEHKYDATKVTKNQTISVSGNVYNSSKQSTSDTSFEVKSGDYEYNVVVNKAGITNIDNADLNDKLSSNLDYVGYLRIDTYCGGLSSGIETEVSNHTYPSTGDNPTQTVWLEVNGSESFSFKPSELGISDTCSIVLTYYVRPTFTNGLFMNIQNDFSITGSIGSGSTYYNISPGTVYVKMQIQQETSCNVTKDFWYYVRAGATDDPETLPTTWDKGAMYWILKVSGTNIPANTAFRDKVMDSYEGTTYKKQEIVKDSSFIGVYIVPKDNKYLSLSDLNEAVENNQATEISSSDYDLAWGEDKKSVDVKFKNNVAIEENKEVYIIVKTKLLEFKIKDENYVYANAAYEKFDGDTDFLLTATPTEYKFQNKKYIAKDITAVFDYDGNGGYSDTYVTAYGHNSSTAFTYKNQNLLKDAGTYIEYTINACIAGTANGDDVIFYDTLPEGLELAYVRNVRFQDGTANNVEMSESELSDKSPWVSNKVGNYPNFTCVDATGTTQQCIYYYNASTREVRWKVDNVNISTTQSGGFSNALTFQLVCKVVDEQVLMGVKDLKVVNSIDEYQYGALVDSTSADAYTFKHKTIDKTPGELNGKTMSFTITVNSTGIDILKDKNTIVLVDEMSSTLKIDDTSIQITDLSTNTLITNYTVAVVEGTDGTTLVKFTIPDNKKLKITYNAKINALSNHTATITNKAYWEGYNSDSGTTVTREVTFTISGSGSITEGATPTINIKKVASNDITKVLEGAEFKLEKVTYDANTQQYSSVSPEFSITGTTDSEGKIVFNDPNLQFDTIYRLTETKAPEGYQLNNRTYYVILINDSKIDYSTYADFEYYKYEEKEQSIDIEITDEPIPSYSLPSAGGIGTKPFKVIGVVFLSGAVIGYAIKRRRRIDF